MLPTLDMWLACFERRAANPLLAPESLEATLSADERGRIARSIASFQLGEQSEGRHFLALARHQAAEQGCAQLPRITELFIREEQRHAATLATFMAANGIPLRRHDWSDRIFRRLRRLAGFELAITILVTAELVGIQYYRALLRSSQSPHLKAICSIFLQDEALHVTYECDLLLALRARRGRLLRGAMTRAHQGFHFGTALAVWFGHRRVLRAGGHTMRGFLVACARHYALYLDSPGPGLVARRDAAPR